MAIIWTEKNIGITKSADGTYSSTYPDNIFAAQAYCPIRILLSGLRKMRTALTGDDADAIADQANLLNATEIMLGTDGYSAVDPAKHWRIRSGTADQHTSFSIGYNIGLSAQSIGMDVDYHLVWDMGHGSNEGNSTGTFIDWINSICTE